MSRGLDIDFDSHVLCFGCTNHNGRYIYINNDVKKIWNSTEFVKNGDQYDEYSSVVVFETEFEPGFRI